MVDPLVGRVRAAGLGHQWHQDGFSRQAGGFHHVVVPFPCIFAFQTAGDASEALPFGLTIDGLQHWTLIYLGLSSLVFVVVWVVGYLRR
jgi:hypothetical protein